MKIGPYELPDKCPEDCPCRGDSWAISQGGMCHRCPVLNCTPVEYEGEMVCLVDPEDYRVDWAAEWVEFFKSGKYPELRINLPPNDLPKEERNGSDQKTPT